MVTLMSFLAGYLGHGCLVLLHQLIHVLLILFQPVLNLIFLTLKATQLLLQLVRGKGRSEGIRPVSAGPGAAGPNLSHPSRLSSVGRSWSGMLEWVPEPEKLPDGFWAVR